MAVYAEGSAQDDVLWALGLLLMGMSLIFILIIHLIGRKGEGSWLARVSTSTRRGSGVSKAGPLRHGRVDGDRRHRHAHRRLHGGLYPVRGHLDAVPAGLSHGAVARQRNAGRRALPAVRLVLSAADHPDHLGAHQPGRRGLLVEYAPDGPIRDIASTAIETLSSLPSIVVGMFGFLVFSVQLGWKYSIISGAVALTMFNIPIPVRVIQQALEDVPQAQRDACPPWALPAGRPRCTS